MNRSQRIAIWVLVLVGLLVTWKLFGQGFGNFRTDQPYLARNYPIGSTEPGTNLLFLYTNIWRWWVASDIPTNHSVSNQWKDRIYGDLLEQGDPAAQPTNSDQGVYFDGNTFLTNVGLAVPSSGMRPMFLFVWEPVVDGASHDVWINSGSPNFNGLRIQPAGNLAWFNAPFGGNDSLGPISTALHDLVMMEINWYTNGVANNDSGVANIWLSSPLIYFGTESGGFNKYKGRIRELIIWTNTGLSVPLPATLISNLHFYTTNRYKFTP